MAYRCDICGKRPMFGHNISHAHNVTKRKFMPNLHRVRVRVDGRVKRIRVCTRCLKAGKVRKV
ncbi:MAG: 50S ribosomal protein L28 [candidate division Zixibacteria bacterium]|nr:50S ribosomal protein L28 [candidate division Zixibacteria bacterium]